MARDWTAGAAPSVAILAPESETEALEGVVRASGGSIVTPEACDLAVTVGEPALVTAVESGASTLLPVDLEAPIGLDAGSIADALERTLADGAHRHAAPLLTCADTRAIFDVSLTASEPGLISEFSVLADGESLETVRADGLTVATPLGSWGAAAAAGGARLDPGAGSLAIVPVADFSLDRHDRVVSQGSRLEISVERDEVPVALRVDGRLVTDDLDVGDVIAIEAAGTVTFLEP